MLKHPDKQEAPCSRVPPAHPPSAWTLSSRDYPSDWCRPQAAACRNVPALLFLTACLHRYDCTDSLWLTVALWLAITQSDWFLLRVSVCVCLLFSLFLSLSFSFASTPHPTPSTLPYQRASNRAGPTSVNHPNSTAQLTHHCFLSLPGYLFCTVIFVPLKYYITEHS